MMFKVYLGFVEPGDQYMGRLLDVLLPNEALFDALPPNLTCGMENQYISEAINIWFKCPFQGRNIANSLSSNTKTFLLQWLAEMVHHSDDFKYVTDIHPDHPFVEWKNIVTTQRSECIRLATGIPPHVEAIRNWRNWLL